MNILFLTLLDFKSLDEKNLYTDLLYEFWKAGHAVYVISPVERRKKEKTVLIESEKATILKARIGNIQKTNSIEKGISTITVESRLVKEIKKYFGNVRFDLLLYSTPPITFCDVTRYVKKRDGAKSYLLLKDIFPQNAVDLGLLHKTGLLGFAYRYFREKEKKLYQLSDYIGCMSQGNKAYLLAHNPEIDAKKVEVCPNSIAVRCMPKDAIERNRIRAKYQIPTDKRVFVYGGNLGKPQGIEHMIACLKNEAGNESDYFVIVGDGTEYPIIEQYIKAEKPAHVKLMERLSEADFDALLRASDIGLIFLDYRFTIPNFPSRMLSYMQAKIPVLACTDSCTDLRSVIEAGSFGWWCESSQVSAFSQAIRKIKEEDILRYGENAFQYLQENYNSENSFAIIMTHFE